MFLLINVRYLPPTYPKIHTECTQMQLNWMQVMRRTFGEFVDRDLGRMEACVFNVRQETNPIASANSPPVSPSAHVGQATLVISCDLRTEGHIWNLASDNLNFRLPRFLYKQFNLVSEDLCVFCFTLPAESHHWQCSSRVRYWSVRAHLC